MPAQPMLERYRDRLAAPGEAFPVTLGEGGTPLLHAQRLGAELGLDRLYLKVEGANPTGSFKDRGMVLAVNRAVAAGAGAVICASTGNTSASAAAYAAAAGLRCVVVLPSGAVARGKLAQAVAAGARLVAVDGNFDAALEAVRSIGQEGEAVIVNSINPDRLLGQQTVAFEIADELGVTPDSVALPVGNAGNITATWAGFARIGARPRMLGFQADGAAPIVRGAPVADPRTAATAIRIGNPASWAGALAARNESGGLIESVSDEAILAMQTRIARSEGVFCEPASAAGVAGVARLAADGRIGRSETIVCILTGHGLKDPDIDTATSGPMTAVPAADLAAAIREAVRSEPSG